MNAIFEHYIKNNPNEFTDQWTADKYADNVCTGVKDAEMGYRLYTQAKELFRKCSMNLRSWATNSPELRSWFTAEDRKEKSVISVLGTEWDAENDSIKIKQFSPATAFSLRGGVLSFVSSFHDVLGLFAPFMYEQNCSFKMHTIRTKLGTNQFTLTSRKVGKKSKTIIRQQ